MSEQLRATATTVADNVAILIASSGREVTGAYVPTVFIQNQTEILMGLRNGQRFKLTVEEI